MSVYAFELSCLGKNTTKDQHPYGPFVSGWSDAEITEQKTFQLLPQDESVNSLPLAEHLPVRGWVKGGQKTTARAAGVKSTCGFENRAHYDHPEFSKSAGISW